VSPRIALRVVLLTAAAAAFVAAAMALQEKRKLTLDTVDDIEAQLAALDPGTRAAVVARLGHDLVEAVRAH
jgi:hypothetical protein